VAHRVTEPVSKGGMVMTRHTLRTGKPKKRTIIKINNTETFNVFHI